MAGLGEYGDEGFSAYHAKRSPFLITQSLSASTVNPKATPLRDFGISAIIAGIITAAKSAAGAGLAKVGALAAKGGAAIAKGVGAKGIAGKLATTGARLGAKAATKWGATKVAAKGILKPVLGAKGKTDAVSIASKNFGKEALGSAKKGDVFGTIENIGKTKGYKALSTTKGKLDQADAEGEMHAGGFRERSSQHFSSTANIGNTNTSATDEDLSSVLTYKVAPFKMKSPYKSKSKSAAYSAAIGSGYSGQIGAIREGFKNIKFGSKTTF
tara:strand:+ start:1403 stop:2212 length:810 start_codon:yes stop_codon:yes gene_type:complete